MASSRDDGDSPRKALATETEPISSSVAQIDSTVTTSSSSSFFRQDTTTVQESPSLSSDNTASTVSDNIYPSEASTGTSLVSFPQEIKVIICGFLDKQSDVADFRLVCRDFGLIGEEFLVETLRCMYTDTSFNNLVNISRVTRLAKRVKTLVFHPFLLSRIEAFVGQHTHYGDLASFTMDPCPTCSSIPPTLEHGWRACQIMYFKQQALIQNNSAQLSLEKSLRNFQNLKQFVLDSSSSRIFEHSKTGNLLSDTAPCTSRKSEWSDSYAVYDDNEFVRLVRSVCSALEFSSAKLDSIHLDGIGWAFFDHILELKGNYLPAFDNLTSIDISFLWDTDDNVSIEISDQRQKNLHKALRRAKELQTLKLDFSYGCFRELWYEVGPSGDFVYWTTVFGKTFVWEHLKTLKVCNIVCESESLSSFFENQVPNLRSLDLGELWLESRVLDWAHILRTMRQNLSLDSLELREAFLGERYDGEPDLLLWEAPHTHWLVSSFLGKRPGKNEEKECMGSFHHIRGESPGKICPYATSTDQDPLDDLEHFAVQFDSLEE